MIFRNLIGFFNKKNVLEPQPEEENLEQKNVSVEERAEMAAVIVSESMDNNDYDNLSEKLNRLTDYTKPLECFVFQSSRRFGSRFVYVISAVMIIIFVCFLVISIGTILLSGSYRDYKIFGGFSLVLSLFAISMNIKMIRNIIRDNRFSKRYEEYSRFLRYKSIEMVDDIVQITGIDRKIVISDLQKAVEYKLIPQGHFGDNNNLFMVSDSVYKDYQENQVEFERYYKTIIENRNRREIQSEETKKLLALGENYLVKIRNSNILIKDKAVTNKLNRMEKIVSAIFHEVNLDTSHIEKLGLFMEYYLSTTEKLLTEYIELDEKQVKGKTVQDAQSKISNALGSLNDVFDSLLVRFYQDIQEELISEIYALNVIIH